MDVRLTFLARRQWDQGGPAAQALEVASGALEDEALSPAARKLSPDELAAFRDGDDEDEPEDDVEVWVLEAAGWMVYFQPFEDDDGARRRLVLRAEQPRRCCT